MLVLDQTETEDVVIVILPSLCLIDYTRSSRVKVKCIRANELCINYGKRKLKKRTLIRGSLALALRNP